METGCKMNLNYIGKFHVYWHLKNKMIKASVSNLVTELINLLRMHIWQIHWTPRDCIPTFQSFRRFPHFLTFIFMLLAIILFYHHCGSKTANGFSSILSIKIRLFSSCAFLAFCSAERRCSPESLFFILLCNSNFRAINFFHQRLIFPLTCFTKSRGLSWKGMHMTKMNRQYIFIYIYIYLFYI